MRSLNTLTLDDVDGRTALTILVQHRSKVDRDAQHRVRDGGGNAGRVRPPRGGRGVTPLTTDDVWSRNAGLRPAFLTRGDIGFG